MIIGVDARDGEVAIDGWTTSSKMSATEVARRFDGAPLDSLLYTDVARDGTRVGPNVEATARLSLESGRAVLASGGVGALEHLRELARASVRPGVTLVGVVVGRALFDGTIALDDAIEAVRWVPPR